MPLEDDLEDFRSLAIQSKILPRNSSDLLIRRKRSKELALAVIKEELPAQKNRREVLEAKIEEIAQTNSSFVYASVVKAKMRRAHPKN